MIGKYYFYEETIHWSNVILQEALTNDVLFLDEFGILEMKNEGFFAGFTTWIEKGIGALIITLRPRLVESFQEMIGKKLSANIPVSLFKLVRNQNCALG